MIIIAGLGNPGAKYEKNRHNIGFMAADEIARRWRFGPEKAKFQSKIQDGEIEGEKILLMKPQTYMNESGRAIGEAARFYKVPVDQLLPGGDDPEDPARAEVDASGARIDLTRLEDIAGAEAEMLSRYLRMIQVQRQDFNGRVLTIRRDDMRAIACILGVTQESADQRLDELGLRQG